MAGSLSAQGAAWALDSIMGTAGSQPGPRQVYLALLYQLPTTTTNISTLAEISTSGYVRQPVTWLASSVTVPAQTSNSAVITYGPFTASMTAPVQGAAVVDVSSGTSGTFLMWWSLDIPVLLNQGQSLLIATNQITRTFT